MTDGACVTVPPQITVPVVEDLDALRALDSDIQIDGQPVSVGDDGEGIYHWDASSVSVDDGELIIRPDDRTSMQAGRWIALGQGWVSVLAGGSGSALVGFLQAGAGAVARTSQAKMRETVSVTDYAGCDPTGATDSTAAFQAAHDAFPDGVEILVPPGLYLVSRVDITNPNITYRGLPGHELKKFGNAGVNGGGAADRRGMFDIRNLLDANFRLINIRADLNGQGPLGYGVAGRIANTYNTKNAITFPTIYGITGPENGLIYALRCSGIYLEDVTSFNSGENGLLFRNCADITVLRPNCWNFANCGIEFNFPDPAVDGGTGPVPDLRGYSVIDGHFEDIDDYLLGTGNGVAILFGAPTNRGAIGNIYLSGNSFTRCQRDQHAECLSGSWIQDFLWDASRSINARQGSCGIINGRNGEIRSPIVIDAGFAPTGALLAQILGGLTEESWPSMNAINLSGDIQNVKVTNPQIIDTRNSKLRVGSDGAITAGSNVFNSASAAFATTDVGTFIGIVGAGPKPGSIASQHIARIVQRNSATQVVLDLNAATTVTGAKYAYGGAQREPLRTKGAISWEISGGIVSAGIYSGLANEPDAQAVLIDTIPTGGRGRIANMRIVAPTTPGTTPAGLRIPAALDGKLELDPNTIRVIGFTANFIGVDTFRAGLLNPSAVARSQITTVSTTINTYGTPYTKLPRGNQFEQITSASVEFDTLNAGPVTGETVTALISAYRYDGAGPNTVTLTATSASTLILTPDQLATLNEDGAWLTSIEIKAKSDKASSTARARLTLNAREG